MLASCMRCGVTINNNSNNDYDDDDDEDDHDSDSDDVDVDDDVDNDDNNNNFGIKVRCMLAVGRKYIYVRASINLTLITKRIIRHLHYLY